MSTLKQEDLLSQAFVQEALNNNLCVLEDTNENIRNYFIKQPPFPDDYIEGNKLWYNDRFIEKYPTSDTMEI